MVYKTLEITLISAKDLKNVNLIGKMDPYVVVHLSDDPKNKQKTPVHQDGGTSPAWNYTMRFTIDDAAAAKPGKYVVFTLKHEHTFGADKDLGEVLVPLKELLDGFKDPSGSKLVTYQVKRVSSQKAQGELKLSYKIIDMGNNMSSGKGEYKPAQSCSSSSSSAAAAAPYPPPGGYGGGYGDVYPPQHHQGYPPSHSQGPPPAAGIPYAAAAPGGYPPQGAGAYPPQQSHGTPGVPYAAAPHGYPQYGGYPPPPNAGYGYPPSGGYPPPGGYPAYPPAGGYGQKPQKPKKGGMGGMGGLGMGLGAGLLGGLVLGEVMDDAFDVDCDF